MVTNQEERAEIRNFGEVQVLTAPAGWVLESGNTRRVSTRVMHSFHPPRLDNVMIAVLYRGAPISADAAAVLKAILNEKPAASGAQPLSGDEIRGLTQVFGLGSVGDNQYTNDDAGVGGECATFKMAEAATCKIGGRTVIRVVGAFQDENGVALNHYCGFYISSRKNSGRVEEIFFQAPNKDRYLEFFPVFESCLLSLKWSQ